MKSWMLAMIVLPLVMTACGNKGGGSSNTTNTNTGTIATVPTPTPNPNCLNGNAYCNSNYYGNYQGFQPYPYNPYFYGMQMYWGGGYSYGRFCDCPPGYRPTYNGAFGLGCVSNTAFQPFAGGAMYWGWGANNNHWINIPQVSNTQSSPSSQSCYNNVAQSCFIGQYNTCGANATCQPTAAGSRMGVCIVNGSGAIPGNNGAGYR